MISIDSFGSQVAAMELQVDFALSGGGKISSFITVRRRFEVRYLDDACNS